VLASQESRLNELGLNGDGKGDDDRMDVFAEEEIVVRLANASVV
jgi:hypothetical protein